MKQTILILGYITQSILLARIMLNKIKKEQDLELSKIWDTIYLILGTIVITFIGPLLVPLVLIYSCYHHLKKKINKDN